MAIIRKGDAYALPVIILADGTPITDADVAGVRIGLGTITAIWPDGQLRYDSGVWLLTVTQAQSYTLPQGDVYYQAQVQLASGETLSSPRTKIHIDSSIFRQPWGKRELDVDGSVEASAVTATVSLHPESITAEIQMRRTPATQTAQPYTTLRRYNYSDGAYRNRKKLFVDLHNLVLGKKYKLWLFTCSRRNGRKYGPWMHPPNYDATKPNEYGVSRFGYGMVAGQPVQSKPEYVFCDVPEWMPNEGFLQTEWDIPTDASPLEISLDTWLLPMIRPEHKDRDNNADGMFDSDATAKEVYGAMIGVAKPALAGKLFRFCLVDDSGVVYPSESTLSVGASKVAERIVVSKKDFPCIDGSTLFSSIS